MLKRCIHSTRAEAAKGFAGVRAREHGAALG
jgi:hypothetical protein